MILGVTLRDSMEATRRQKASFSVQLEELQNWIDQAALWEQRANWLAENPPPVWERDVTESELVQELQTSLAEAGMEILNQRLLETSDLPGFREIGVQLQLRGSTEAVVRWLHQLQQPGRYIAIRQFNLKSDADRTNLRAEIHLTRHYSEPHESP